MSTASDIIAESEAEAAPRPGLALRLKRLLAAPILLLRRLRQPHAGTQAGEAEAEERDLRDETADENAEASAAPPPWRRLLPYGLVLLAGAAAGGGALYWLSAQAIARQAAEIDEQQSEVARLKGLVAGYDKMMLQTRKKLEEEQGKRAELENRLAMAQADLLRQPQAPSGRNSAASNASHNAAGSGKTADCTLRPGTIGSTLKSCIEEFNRR